MEISNDLQKNLMGIEDKGTRTVTSQGVQEEGDTSLFGQNEELGKDDFLNLLVTQLKYQDPLEPTNDTEFVAQLAQYSSLESSQNIESNISDLSESMKSFADSQAQISGSLNNSSATTLLGKTVRVSTPMEYFDGAKNVKMNSSVEDAGAAYLQVLDTAGEEVYRKAVGNKGPGDYSVSWDGSTTNGMLAQSGEYSFRITDVTGKQVKGFLYEEAPVTGITYGTSGAEIKINDKAYGLGEIKQVVDKS